MPIKFRDEKLNRTLINIFKELEDTDDEIKKWNTEIYKHVNPFEDPEESRKPIVIDLLKLKDLSLKEYNLLINKAKKLTNIEHKAIFLKCDYFINDFSNTQERLDYINGKLKDETILDGTRELFTSLAYNSTVSSYSPFNINYVAYKLPQIFRQEATIVYDKTSDFEKKTLDNREVSNELAKKIIETRKPVGKFYTVEEDLYIGIDNSNGDAWTEEFKTKEECLNWLNDKELEDEFEIEL